jgi:hypothetical protein
MILAIHMLYLFFKLGVIQVDRIGKYALINSQIKIVIIGWRFYVSLRIGSNIVDITSTLHLKPSFITNIF